VFDETMTQKAELACAGTVTALDASDCWVFAASSSAVAGEMPVEVGLLRAWSLAADAAGGLAPATTLDLRAPGCAFAHARAIGALEAANVGQPTPVLFSGGGEGLIRLWVADATSRTFVGRALEGHARAVTALHWSAGIGRLYSGSEDMTVKVWDVGSGVCGHTVLPPGGGAGAGAGGGGLLRLADLTAAAAATGGAAAAAAAPGHAAPIVSVDSFEISTGARFLVTAALDGSIKVWSLEPAAAPTPLPMLSVEPSAPADRDDGRQLVAARVLEAEAAPDAPYVVCGHKDGTLVVRDLHDKLSADVVLRWDSRYQAGHHKSVRAIVPFGARNMFLTAGADGFLNIFLLFLSPDEAPPASPAVASFGGQPYR